MGPAREHHMAMWRQVSEMLEAGLTALTPGRPLSACRQAIDEVLHRHWSAQERAQMTGFRYGHGLGMSYEDPLITDCFPQSFGADVSLADAPDSEETAPGLILQPGMLLELHPNVFLPGQGGAAIGEMVVIREDAAESLLKFPTGFMEL